MTEPEIDPVTGKPVLLVGMRAAPRGQFRVAGWRLTPENTTAPWIEGDFPVRADAVATADRLKSEGAYSVAVFNDRGRTVHVRSDKAANSEWPISVTRLAGQTDPLRRTGSYRRK